jgi:protein gp37
MTELSKIAWTDSTFNPWIGCTKIGPGCDHCYAEAQDRRKRWGGTTHWGVGVPRHRTSPSYWKQPLAWDKKAASSGKPWRVFCASLADVFDNEVPVDWRYDLWNIVEATPNLSWLLVTKRIGNVASMVPPGWHIEGAGFPTNVRILITVCNQEEADRDIPKLLALPCRNGISYEPALGPVDWSKWNWIPHDHSCGQIEWIIVGGESAQGGAQARPFVHRWGKDTVAQCRAAGVPVFVKQMGSNAVNREGERHEYKDRAGANLSEWPDDLRVREFPG